MEWEHEQPARAFSPLPWFGPEVTSDRRYTNQSIALRVSNKTVCIG
jgi:CYTH domain-containing protein